MGLKHFLFFCLGGLAFTACGGIAANFPFKYYGLKADSYGGRLEGPTDKEDLPLERCKPSQGEATPCFVFLKAEMQRMKTKYREAMLELEDYQRRCPRMSESDTRIQQVGDPLESLTFGNSPVSPLPIQGKLSNNDGELVSFHQALEASDAILFPLPGWDKTAPSLIQK